jgi:hypothetical protein
LAIEPASLHLTDAEAPNRAGRTNSDAAPVIGSQLHCCRLNKRWRTGKPLVAFKPARSALMIQAGILRPVSGIV